MSHVRIEESADVCGPFTKIFYIASDGTETDISDVTTAVSYTGKVGEANRATVDLIKVRCSITAPLVDVVIEEIGPQSKWRDRILRFFCD